MAVSLCVTPASALDLPDGITDFYDWTLRNGGKPAELFWKAIYGDSWDAYLPENKEDAASKYEEYVNGLQTDLGSVVVGDGGFYLYAIPYNISMGGDWSVIPHTLGAVTSFGPYSFGSSIIKIYYNALNAPVSGYYTYFRNISGVNCSDKSPGKLDSGTASGANTVNFQNRTSVNSGTQLISSRYNQLEVCVSTTDFSSGVVSHGWFVEPLSDDMSEFTGLDLSTDSRSASVLGNLGIIGDDGQITKIQDNSSALIDEFNKVYWNPVTNEQQSFSQYTYNYEDRSYNLTMEDGSTVKVVYGDENITINEGDTIYNVYYLSSDSGSGGSGSGDGSGNGGEVGDAVSGLLGGLGNILAGLIEGLLKMAAQAVEALGGLIDIFNGLVDMILGFFSGFTGFLGSMFPFLPEETFVILNFGLILLIAAAVIKKLFL